MLAQAVQAVNPEAKLGIGPPVTDGFYYDFDVAEPFTPEDLKALDKEMARIVRQGQRFMRRVVTDDEARVELADEPYKLELIGLKGHESGTAQFEESESVEVGGAELTIYDNVDPKTGETVWKDLCRGPHLPNTRMIGNGWALSRVAAAYWRGSEKNPQLQRIYGTAWPTKDELRAYQHRLEEAARRDHRKLGAELDLFSFPEEIGSGLPVFHPRGGVIKREMEDYVRRRHIEEGFQYVSTPHITKAHVFELSGHLPYYKDTMFPPMELENSEYYLKAMNCPMQNLIFRSRGRSYRELPLRFFEFGTVYRYEKSGVVQGLTRVRGLTQDDSHSYVTPEQAPGEIQHLLDFVLGPAARLRPRRLLPRAVDARREHPTSSRAPTSSGRSPPTCFARSRRHPVSSSFPTRAVRPSTGRRSPCRRATPSVAPGRCRPSSTTSTSRRASGSSTPRPTAPTSSP